MLINKIYWICLHVYLVRNTNKQEIWEIVQNKKTKIDKKMKWKLIDATLLRMEDKPKSLNKQRHKGLLIKLKGSWITQVLRRITFTKIKEINSNTSK